MNTNQGEYQNSLTRKGEAIRRRSGDAVLGYTVVHSKRIGSCVHVTSRLLAVARGFTI